MTIKTFTLLINIAQVALVAAFGAICFEVLNGTSQANVSVAFCLTVFFGLMLGFLAKLVKSCN